MLRPGDSLRQTPMREIGRTDMTSPFDSIRIGPLEIANRLAMAPVKTAFGTPDGRVTDQVVDYFGRRAAGGVGLIISEPLYVDIRGKEHPKQLGIDGDDKEEGLRRLVDAVHAEGGRIFAHLNHGGRAANPKAAGGPPEAPSKVACPRTGFEPEVLTEDRIAKIVKAFADAAGRARRCGFDGVELQFGLGYLVAQFLSPATNLRTDGYGGDGERRMRFAGEVYAAVRDAVGKDFPVSARVSGSEKAKGGLEIDDAKALARTMEAAGLDLVHVATGSNCESLPWYFQHMALPPGVNEALAAQVRKDVSIPVMAAGRLGDPPRIREVIGSGMVDMVALGRPLIADPDLPNKMRDGRDDEVLLCGHCLQGCFANVKAGKGIGCNFNPVVGQEPGETARAGVLSKVVVVGGGPAGMQAALTAHRRGHRVVLFEKDRLGGQFLLAPVPPGKKRMEQPLRSLVSQVERSGMEIRLGEEATREKVEALGPDAVIIATGSRPAAPDIEGLEGPVPAEDVLRDAAGTGSRVLVLGGGMVGMETAEVLAGRGRQVVVVEMLEEVAGDMDPISRKMMMMRLASLPVETHTSTQLLRMEGRRAIAGGRGETRDLGEFDTVVTAVGNRPFDPLSEDLRAAGLEVHVIGDATQPGKAGEAIRSGHSTGMSIGSRP
jgi:2,4-dienoyl-CoA reductase-like NADH-dependent reductase (Old Yellow Enzyme family)/thioredoxin reductase